MATKNFKTNARGEAQLATWLPLKIMKEIYSRFDKVVLKAKKDGDYVPKFKEFFIKNYIAPNHKK